ncbi:flavodoxin family protein [Methylocystis sp.]|uniref:flavodoxin family protein n=1 Tax=Methylocystis sp. TaxID=1911079 RepID=UPI003DA24CA6
MFGNTESLAAIVGAGLSEAGAIVEIVDVRDAAAVDLSGSDLLVVAAPTHALSLSRPESRAQAVERGADPAKAELGVREWLVELERLLPTISPQPVAAVFDTRVTQTRHWPGSAAHRAARTLRHEGFRVVARTSFYVEGIAGPLSPGESERAREWGAGLPELAVPGGPIDHRHS